MTHTGIPVTVEFPGGSAVSIQQIQDAISAYLIDETDLPPAEGSLSIDKIPEAQRGSAMNWYASGIDGQFRDLDAAKGLADEERDVYGRGWEKICADVAYKVQRLALAAGVDVGDLRAKYLATAPRGGYITDDWLAKKWNSQGRIAQAKGPWPLPDNFGATQSYVEAMFSQDPTDGAATPTAPAPVDVSNPAIAHQWLRREAGTEALSGVLRRGADLVFVQRLMATGEVVSTKFEGDLQVLTGQGLQARIQNRYHVIRSVKTKDEEGNDKFEDKPAMFPKNVAESVVAAPNDLPNVRPLTGVTQSPIVRADGSVLDAPGYDEASGMLYLPDGPRVAPVPATPTADDVAKAKGLIDFMLADYAFVTAEDKANYIGLMLTPLLRLLTAPPFKMASIEAHQPGSGKSFLGRALISLHGGAERGTLPTTEEEFHKTVGAILDTSTGAVAMFDNVTGVVRSPALASLLTQPRYVGRRLGGSTNIDAPNDRLWVMTANNAQIGGDLARRVVRVMIDPGVPNPERRTNFRIPDWENWVREHREEILWSLLVLVRHWHASGARTQRTSTDSYARWTSVVDGVLRSSGYAGFDAETTRAAIEDQDAEELREFIDAVKDAFGEEPWTVKQLVGRLTLADTVHPTMVAQDALPEFTTLGGMVNAKKLGRWIARNRGRWVDDMTLIQDGTVARAMRWRIKTREEV